MAQDAGGSHKPIEHAPVYLPEPRPHKKQECCPCPACQGLQCLERPRYFAGQLLTEAELNSEQAYVIAKNRLHNRYLHGWGVVCGLEVVCHNCAGWVKVRAGYALDPCGNDVIVCRDAELDVLGAIQKCIDARRRDDDCPPWRDPNDNCADDEKHWCITLQYVENEGRAVMPLQESKSHCGCGGKCGGGCDCGSNGKKNGGCSCGGKPKASSKKPSCEPTRVFEQYRLGVIPEPEECAVRRRKTTEDRGYDDLYSKINTMSQSGIVSIGAFIPKSILKHPLFPALVAAAPDDSIFMRAVEVARTVNDFLYRRFTTAELKTLREIAKRCRREEANPQGNAPSASDETATGLYPLCCKLRRAIKDLYADNPLNVRCVPFDCPPCAEHVPPSATDHAGGEFPAAAPAEPPLDPMCCLFDALMNYFVDALCMLFLPTCPTPPCENRVILACVTIRDGKIVHICNHACRHYAGSFNSVQHWMSALPVIPLIGSILRDICCSDEGFEVLLNVRGTAKPQDPVDETIVKP